MISSDVIARLTLQKEADFSLDFLSQSLDLYWSHVAPLFPFIHRGTFDVDTAPPELVIMMVIVGSVHFKDPSAPDFPPGGRKALRALVKKIRGALVQNAGTDMANSVIQAFCLCHVHDVWYATSESLYVAQLTWPVMVAHTRKKGVGVVGRTETEGKGEVAWNAWAKDEGGSIVLCSIRGTDNFFQRRATPLGVLYILGGHADIRFLEPAPIATTFGLCPQPEPTLP